MEFAASSSSSSSSSSSFLKSEPQFRYDVFINFWGEDIGRKLVSHLHSVLLQAQVKTLIKEGNLQEGMELEEHMRAIAASKIAIIVFSKSYTESIYCLLQLDKIIECHETFGQIILPIFYEIGPLEVRYQKDDFGKELEEAAHKSYSGEQLEHALSRWSRALTKAAGIRGWDIRDFRHDAELVEKVVFRVLEFLDYENLSITQFPVGLDSRMEKVIGCIENHSTKVCMIGIWGMGGSGKTTIAKAIYNRIYRLFIGKSFIENISEVWDRVNRRHVDLQENLLSGVLKSKLEVESVGMGRTMIENGLSRKKLLIVLDDVNGFDQLKNLCGNREWFGQGTVIIITTRDVDVLNRLKVDYVYNMNENESLELFSWHAFGEAKPRKDFNELARNMVAYCGGLPVALKVAASLLYKRRVEEYENVLLKLKIIPKLEVQKILRLSFDLLCYDMEQDIFFDLCCFFTGKDRGYVTDILNGCGLPVHIDIGTTALTEHGLIKVERNNTLPMHRLLRDMAREIIPQSWPQELGKRSRLWFQDNVKDVLKENTGTEATQGLSLKLHSNSRDCFKAHAFKKMKGLKLLQVDNVRLSGDYGYLSKQLRWTLCEGFPSEYINSIHMENVIVIVLKHNLQLVWKQPQVLKWLKFLNLSHSKFLRETPDFSGLPSLEKLILKDCPSLCNVFPSIIRSWMSPTLNLQSFVSPFCMDMENNNWHDLAPLHSSLANLRSILVQGDTEFQLCNQVKTILVEYGVNFTESRISKHHLSFSLIGVGSYNEFLNTLTNSVSEGLASSESCDVSLSGDNHPYWLAHMASVSFTVPQDCEMYGMALCVVYLSTPEIVATECLTTECLTSVLVVNYTKCTLQIHKRGRVISFNDEVYWHAIMSSLGSGDKVEIFVSFGHGLVVKNTAAYLIYDESNDLKMDSCPEPKENALIKFFKKMVMCDLC